MSKQTLRVTTQAKVTTLSLNRPEKCNALNGPLLQNLQDAFFKAERDPHTRLVLLKGEGNHFCAGADIDWLQQLARASVEENKQDAQQLAALLLQLYSFPKPLVTLVHGSIFGGGLGLLACSDLVFAAQGAHFCFSEVKIGLLPAVISPYIIAAIGERAARYYFLTGEPFNALEAQRLGLVHQVLAPEALEDAAAAMIKKILRNSPAALSETKRLLTAVVGQEISRELAAKTADIFATIRLSPEAQEGLSAFLEKRAPHWS
jgi:methylglutaconyl-CoA hydratase